MRKILLAGFVMVSFALYSLGLRHDAANTVVTPNRANQHAPTSSSTAPSGSGSTPPAMGTASSSYKDGTYTGSAADAFYGNIQVAVTIQGRKITDVQFLQYPNDRRDSIMINQQAMPILKQEAISAQSAQVDGVSGATDTSQAFVQSLSSALQEATNG